MKEMVTNHRSEIKEIITNYRADQKEERKAFEQKIDKIMADHIVERSEARQQWQFSIKEISEQVSDLTKQIREVSITKH